MWEILVAVRLLLFTMYKKPRLRLVGPPVLIRLILITRSSAAIGPVTASSTDISRSTGYNESNIPFRIGPADTVKSGYSTGWVKSSASLFN